MKIDEAIKELTQKEKSLNFSRLKGICESLFGTPRVSGSHHIFATGLDDPPTVNIQSRKGKAKSYQIRQVRQALEKLCEGDDNA